MPSSPSSGGGASIPSGAPWRPSRFVRSRGCGMLASLETAGMFLGSWMLSPRALHLRTLTGPELAFSRRSGVRRRLRCLSAWLPPGPSHGVFKDRPSIDTRARRPLLRSSSPVARLGLPLRPAFARGRSRSVFAVSHRLDGFLRRARRGFVAPRSRSWGSSCSGSSFGLAASRRAPSTVLHPSKGFPRQQPPLSPDSCPLIVHHPRMVRSRGLAPLVESVASFACCHAKEPDPPLGFSLFIDASPHPPTGAVVPKDHDLAAGAISARGALVPKRPPKRAPGPVAFLLEVPPSSGRLFAGRSAWGVYGLTQAGGVQE
jgi:hypothetical protein